MSYFDAIKYLYGLQKYGIKLGLEKTGEILAQLGDPQRGFPSVHIAGTNGKGSVSAMVSSMLAAGGCEVGLFTSPHLVSFTERIRINNRQISEAEVIRLTEEIRGKISNSATRELDPTFFEFVTAMAFLHFQRNKIDWAVIETGMGGRLDATNTVMPEVTVITRISYDHREFLGATLPDIAAEKAGIIKKGVPVVCATQEQEAEEVICAAARGKSAPLFMYGKDFGGELHSSGLNGITFSYHDDAGTISDLHVPLAGEHQLINACLALKAATLALKSSNESLRKGLASTRWPGRLDLVSEDPPIMVDGAHNPDAATALSGFIRQHLSDRRLILVMGVMADKDVGGILKPLLPLASEVIFTAPNYGRAASPATLAGHAAAQGISHIRTASTVREAIEFATRISEELNTGNSSLITAHPPLILITGSFYTIGEAMEVLGEKATLGSLRETL
ncbi:MAG TPA: folylpolyglutamate synthase/dihydrofolate synthase family protein [Dissulfurispiraceae bacterium]